jgi:hypothetical protein
VCLTCHSWMCVRRYEMEKVLPHWALSLCLSLALREIDRKVHAGGILSGCIASSQGCSSLCMFACMYSRARVHRRNAKCRLRESLFIFTSLWTHSQRNTQKSTRAIYFYFTLRLCAFAFRRFFSMCVCVRLVVVGGACAFAREQMSRSNAISNILAGSARG